MGSDKTKLELLGYNNKNFTSRHQGKSFIPKNIIPTTKHEGKSIRFWICFSTKGTRSLVRINGIMKKRGLL